MILLPILVLLSGISLLTAIHHLDQSIVTYYDFVALVMVLGGTITLGIILLPWEYRKDIWKATKFLVRKEKPQFPSVLRECISVTKGMAPSPDRANDWLYKKILSDGVELVYLGLPTDRIEIILQERMFQTIKRWKKISAAVRNLAKYPPAFGLMGTVLGLVNIMRSLAEASQASQLGAQMSIALVATMYGLLVANFIVNPIGELLLKKSEEEEDYAELAIESVLLLSNKASYIEAHEMLNAMVPDEHRLTFENLEEAA
ncbi:MAG: Chemotaxis protein PomA [Ignavibacteriaceae bacterium]|nr:Chemotaxis protein PomA [Ignavibacteriaceae bacterium]GIL17922.1 MAG: chemotaxis protein MotA [Oligoflexia bacterium]